MSLYNESTETVSRTVTRFTRSNLITIDNPNGLPPQITFVEERIEREAGRPDRSLGNVGSLSKALTPENGLTEFTLLNPLTGDAIGTARYQDLQVMLHSLYFHLATERDNG